MLPHALCARHKHGKALIDSLDKALLLAKQDSAKVKLLASLSYEYNTINPDTGIKYGMRSLALAEKNKWETGIALASNSLGINYESVSQYPKALQYFERALTINERLKDSMGIAQNLGNIGTVYGFQGHFPNALECFLRSMSIHERLGNTHALANTYGNIGNIYLVQDNYNKARWYYAKALKISEDLADSSGIADDLAVLGTILDKQNEPRLALGYFSRSLAMQQSIGNKAAIAFVINGMGTAHLHLRNYNQALQYYSDALRINKEINNEAGGAANVGDIGACYLQMAQHASMQGSPTAHTTGGKDTTIRQAITHLANAVFAFKQIGDLDELQKYTKQLSEAQLLSGDAAEAFATYAEYEKLRDSIFSNSSKKEIANLDSKRALEASEKDVQLKNQQLEIKRLEITNTQNKNLILIGGIALLTGVIITILNNLKKERRKAADRLLSNEHRFRSLIQHSSDAKVIITPAGTVAFASASIKTVLGYDDSSVTGTDFFSLLHPNDVQPVKDTITTILQKSGMVIRGYTGRMKLKDGRWCWIEMTVTNLLFDPAINGIVCNFRDVTQKKIADERFQLVVESAPNAMLLVNGEGKLTLVNRQAEKLFGYTRSELVDQPLEILLPGRFAERHTGFRKTFFDSPEARPMGVGRDLFARRKDGLEIPVEVGLNPLETSEGPMVLAAVVDITERKTAEKKLIASNRLYNFISAINQAIVHLGDQQSVFNEACRIAHELGKYKDVWIGIIDTDAKVINLVAEKGLLPEDAEFYSSIYVEKNAAINHVVTTGTYYLCNNVDQMTSGGWKAFAKSRGVGSFIILPLRKNGCVAGTFSLTMPQQDHFDETELALLMEAAGDVSFALEVFEKDALRQAGELKLRLNEERLKQAQAIAHLGSWHLNFNTGISTWSEEACRIYGMQPHETAQTYETWVAFIHPDDAEYVKRTVLQGQNTLTSTDFHHRIVRRDGTVRHIHAQSEIDYKNGIPVGLYGIVHDVTEQKQAEDERMKVLADMVRRNNDLEQFSYIVSHNLRLPVANIIGLTNLLQEDDMDAGEQAEMMHDLSTSAIRLDMVIRDLNYILQVRNQVSEHRVQIDLESLLADIEASIRNLLKNEAVTITSDFALKEVTSVKSYLYSIFFNLIANSIKYHRPGTAPVIEIRSRKVNNQWVLTFADNGLGIDLKRGSQHMFGLYKRFHDHVEGKGMGLYMVKTQVETLGGKISVESEVNKGTTFTITFEQF